MKSLRTFLAIASVAAAAAFTTSCGDIVEVTEVVEVQKVSFNITIDKDHWVWNPNMGSWVHTVYDISELTPNIIEKGLYHMYLYKMDGDVEVREALPYIEYGESSNGLWQRHFACDYGPHAVTFYIRNADFYDRAPETLHFRFVAIW